MRRLSVNGLPANALPIGIVLLVIGVVVVFAAVVWPEEEVSAGGPGHDPLPVVTAPVQWESAYTVTRWYVGRVEARQRTEMGFEISGRILSIDVEEGDVLQPGDPVAHLDDSRLQAQRSELVAARDQAFSLQELAAITVRRITEARERNAASEWEWDEAEKSLDAAQAALRRAEAALISIDVELDKTKLTSPFEAVVSKRHVDVGQVVDGRTTVVELLERRLPEVRVSIGGSGADILKADQLIDVMIGADSVKGTISSVLPTRDRADRGVEVVIRLDAELGELRAGDLARITVDRTIDERGFWVPIQALAEGTRGLWSLYTLDHASSGPEVAIVRRAEIEILQQETDRVYVRGPLQNEDRFVSRGLHRIAPGMSVRVDTADALVRSDQP